MRNTSTDKSRAAVPRWRPLIATPISELASRARAPAPQPWSSEVMAWQVDAWRSEGTLEAAADIFDFGIVSGNRKLEVEGAASILSHGKDVPGRLLAAVRQAMTTPKQSHRASLIHLNPSTVIKDVYHQLRILKQMSREFPRNALIRVECARFQAQAGQHESARRNIIIALGLAPDNRYVLRSAANFFCSLDDPAEVLLALRSALGFKDDPWLLSAELAASQLSRTSTKLPKGILRSIRSQKKIVRSASELASGIALLEHESGVKRRQVSRIITATLHDPTENALAQAFWLGEQVGHNVTEAFANVAFDDNAWEARAATLFHTGNFVDSEIEATRWLIDQPLEARAALAVSYTNMIQLQNYKRAAEVAERAAELHSEDWAIQNCALLSDAFAGDLDSARQRARVLRREGANDDEIMAFALAGEGLIEFMAGNIERGRERYLDSTRLSRKLRRPDYMVNAVIFWLEREVVLGLIDEQSLNKELKYIERAILRLAPAQKVDTQNTFQARSEVMRNVVNRERREVSAGTYSIGQEILGE